MLTIIVFLPSASAVVCCGTDVVFEQKRKRRKLYREPSVSPVVVEEPQELLSFFPRSPSRLWKHYAHQDSDVVSSCDDDQRSKVRFLRLLGLERVSHSSRAGKLPVC